jgi:peptidoglycan/xylan/chitin deacetylase (PgdA/CDA1 family)
VVTFDDGYENNYLSALPVLEELQVPATVFLATAFLDHHGPFPFDDWSAAGSKRVPDISWRPLTTEECRLMTASGLVELGAHTHTHQRFAGRCQDFARDLETSVAVLRDRFDILQPTFAFPFGLNSPEMIDAAKKAGVRCALTTQPERSHLHTDAFGWGRFAADDADTAATLAAKMNGWYEPVAGVVRAIQKPLGAFRKTAETPVTDLNPCDVADGEEFSLNQEFAEAQTLESCEP